MHSLVDNPNAISLYGVQPLILFNDTVSNTFSYTTGPTLPPPPPPYPAFATYIIITNDYLKPYFNSFISYKQSKGIRTRVVTLGQIYYWFPNGDLISGINDAAGCIRQYLSNAYEDGTTWVLLAGDHEVVPIRYGTGWYLGNVPIPADLYFSDFNGNWNVDLDPLYGEEYHDNGRLQSGGFCGSSCCI